MKQKLMVLIASMFMAVISTSCIAPEYNPVVNKDLAQLNYSAINDKSTCPSVVGFVDLAKQINIIETQIQYRTHNQDLIASLNSVQHTIQSVVDVNKQEGKISQFFCEESYDNLAKEIDRLLKAYNVLEGIK